MLTKNKLDELATKYENEEFINPDPVRFIHKYRSRKDIEIAGFLASLFAYGNRKAFIAKLETLMQIMNNKPLEYIINFEPKSHELDNFDYRFSKGCDIKEIILILKKLYKDENSSLMELFQYGWETHGTVKGMFITVCDYFYSNVKNNVTQGFYHLIPDAHKTSALKRMNMFLRWMVRKSIVDTGIWTFMPPSELIIPLDTHVARISVELGLIEKANGDFKTAQKITNKLKEFDANDPVKYDFALFGYGVNNPVS